MQTNYKIGRRKEYKIRKEQIAKGRLAFRSAGSHSPVDVVSIDWVDHKILLIQCKPDSLGDNQRNKLIVDNKKLNGVYGVMFVVV